jgi:hypothetical protein
VTTVLRALLLPPLAAALIAAGAAPLRAAGCGDEAGQVEAQLKKLKQDEAKHRGETGKAGLPTQGFYGTPKSIGRSLELVHNAKELAAHGKEASCRDLVQEARRAAGLQGGGSQ